MILEKRGRNLKVIISPGSDISYTIQRADMEDIIEALKKIVEEFPK